MTRSTDLAVWPSLANPSSNDHADCKHLPLRAKLSEPLDPQVGVPLRADFPNMHELTPDFERFIRDLEDFNHG